MATLLVPLDGSALAEHALLPARQMAAALGASIVLVRVVQRRAPELRGVEQLDVEAAERYLCGVARELRDRGEIVLVEACAGDAGERILEQAALWHADLIVMSTHGRGGVSRLLHGSVAEAVVRGTRTPVLLVPSRAGERPSISGEAVVVPVDGSPFAETAVARAAEIARGLATPLLIVRSVSWSPGLVTGLESTFDVLDDLETEARRYVDGLVDGARRAGVDAHGDVLIGPAAGAILGYADQRGAALIVMATHGRTGLGRLTMGSVATDVLTHTTHPLLLVRPDMADVGRVVVADGAVRLAAGAA